MQALHPHHWQIRVALMIGLLTFGGMAMSLEQPDYTVVHKDGDVEYRQYASYLVSETVVDMDGDYKRAGNEGFRRLFRYISGGNTSQSKIAMTVPVQQGSSEEKIAMTKPVQQSPDGDAWRVAFMLPSEYTLETAPRPRDPRVSVREVPPRLVAVLRFSGRWTSRNFTRKERELLETLRNSAVETVGNPESAVYSAPYVPPFLRRNEVMVAVNGLPATAGPSLQRAAAAY